MSITNTWEKETKQVSEGTLTLYKQGLSLLGISFSKDGDIHNAQNESWSYGGCVALEEAREMKFFEPEECATEEQLRRWFNTGNIDFTDN